MPTISVTNEEVDENIFRPVAMEVIRQVIDMTDIPANTKIFFLGGLEKAKHENTAIGPEIKVQDDIKNTHASNHIRMDVSEEPVLERIYTAGTFQEDARWIFGDVDYGIHVKPIFQDTEMTISVRCMFEDKTTAEKWRNGITRRCTMMHKENLHQVDMHYLFPKEFIVILYYIHATREKTAPLGETFQEWIRRCITPNATTLANRAGEQARLAIALNQSGIVGWFDFTGFPAPVQRNKEDLNWETGFDYKVRYETIKGFVMRYPYMIHNTLLHKNVSPRELPWNFEKVYQTQSLSKLNFDKTQIEETYPQNARPGTSIPFWDDWFPTHEPPVSTCMLRVMLQIKTTDLRTLCNLTEMGEYEIDADIVDYIKKQPSMLLEDGGSPFIVSIYEGNTMLLRSDFTVDANLLVTANRDLDLQKPYHLHLAMRVDLAMLTTSAANLLRRNAKACMRIFQILDPDFLVNGPKVTVIRENDITDADFKKAVDYLTRKRHMYKSLAEFVKRCHVGFFGVSTPRGD